MAKRKPGTGRQPAPTPTAKSKRQKKADDSAEPNPFDLPPHADQRLLCASNGGQLSVTKEAVGSTGGEVDEPEQPDCPSSSASAAPSAKGQAAAKAKHRQKAKATAKAKAKEKALAAAANSQSKASRRRSAAFKF